MQPEFGVISIADRYVAMVQNVLLSDGSFYSIWEILTFVKVTEDDNRGIYVCPLNIQYVDCKCSVLFMHISL